MLYEASLQKHTSVRHMNFKISQSKGESTLTKAKKGTYSLKYKYTNTVCGEKTQIQQALNQRHIHFSASWRALIASPHLSLASSVCP